MPTVNVNITGTTDVDVVVPPKHRKVKVVFLRVYNAGTSDSVLTLKQISPDSSVNKTVDIIPISANQVEVVTAEKMVYDLDRGFKLAGVLDAAGDVKVTVTYELE